MTYSWKFFLFLILICLVFQGFFSMVEMACVSFNKVRLQYYVSRKKKRALWISYLLHHPALLFGTSLICVNAALVVGSESARRFYDALGFSPDWAPLSQIFLVLIFAEISPMLAGRRYSENVAILGIPILFFFSILLRPLIWMLDLICRGINRMIGKSVISGMYLSREELQNIIEEKEEKIVTEPAKGTFNTIAANIFTLKNKSAKDLMLSLSQVPIVPSFCNLADARKVVKEKQVSFLPIYHRNAQNIVAIAYPRDLLRLSENKKIKDFSRPPWFITENSSILQILKQFRRNNQSLAVVLSDKGLALGILTLDEIIDEIFGTTDEWVAFEEMFPRAYHVVVDKTFPGEMRLDEFNRQFNVKLDYKGAETLEELMTLALGHSPSKGESIHIDQFELTVEEASLLGAKMIQVRTVF